MRIFVHRGGQLVGFINVAGGVGCYVHGKLHSAVIDERRPAPARCVLDDLDRTELSEVKVALCIDPIAINSTDAVRDAADLFPTPVVEHVNSAVSTVVDV